MSNLLLFNLPLFWPDEKVPFISLNRIRIRIWIRIHFESGSRSKTYILVFGISAPTQVSDPYEVTNLVRGLDPHTAYLIPRFFNDYS